MKWDFSGRKESSTQHAFPFEGDKEEREGLRKDQSRINRSS
jgi:hypothetical protein